MDIFLLRERTNCFSRGLKRALIITSAPLLPKGEQRRLHSQIVADTRWEPPSILSRLTILTSLAYHSLWRLRQNSGLKDGTFFVMPEPAPTLQSC